MSTSKEELFRLALDLSDKERAALAGMLLDSLEPSDDADVEAAWLVEIEQRISEVDSGGVQPVSWDLVRDRLRRKLAE